MATLSGETVAVGDKVYDVTQGYGTVVSDMFNGLQVRFNNGVRISYEEGGIYGGVRRLYWHDPVVIDPPKNRPTWDVLRSMMGSIRALLVERGEPQGGRGESGYGSEPSVGGIEP